MAKIAGSIWVDGITFHYVDKNGAEWTFTGVDTGASVGSVVGSFWISDVDATIRYIDNVNHQRKIISIPGVNRTDVGAIIGSLWVESTANTDYSLTFIDASHIQRSTHVKPATVILNGVSHTSGFFSAAFGGIQSLTVVADLIVTIYASAGGGGGGNSFDGDGAGGSGGGGAASNNSGMAFTLLAGKNYTVRVGAGGGSQTAGGETSIHNDTDGVYLFRFGGGVGGAFNAGGGSGGAVLVGTGVTGGSGGSSAGNYTTVGSNGGNATNGAGGGGAGGNGRSVLVGGDAHNGGNGGSGSTAGTAGGTTTVINPPGEGDEVVLGGDGGNGGGVSINVGAIITGFFGAAGGGHGGSVNYATFGGTPGANGVLVIDFTVVSEQPVFVG